MDEKSIQTMYAFFREQSVCVYESSAGECKTTEPEASQESVIDLEDDEVSAARVEGLSRRSPTEATDPPARQAAEGNSGHRRRSLQRHGTLRELEQHEITSASHSLFYVGVMETGTSLPGG